MNSSEIPVKLEATVARIRSGAHVNALTANVSAEPEDAHLETRPHAPSHGYHNPAFRLQ